MNINPPQPSTPVRNTKLFFPLTFVFSQRCRALAEGGFSSEQYQRHKLIGGIFNQVVEGFKPIDGISDYTQLVRPPKIANLVPMKKNPLEAVEAYDSITTVWLHGKEVGRERRSDTLIAFERLIPSLDNRSGTIY